MGLSTRNEIWNVTVYSTSNCILHVIFWKEWSFKDKYLHLLGFFFKNISYPSLLSGNGGDGIHTPNMSKWFSQNVLLEYWGISLNYYEIRCYHALLNLYSHIVTVMKLYQSIRKPMGHIAHLSSPGFFSNIKYAFRFYLLNLTPGSNYFNQFAFVLCQNALMKNSAFLAS
jgi:hypothetical protein